MLSGRALGYGSVVERRKVAGSIAGTAGGMYVFFLFFFFFSGVNFLSSVVFTASV